MSHVQTPILSRGGPSDDHEHFSGIQGLRFVAALLVVVTHTVFYAHERLDPSFRPWSYGSVGVDIFFAISGFVMMQSVRRLEGTPRAWRTFARRRLHRIVPLYWIATTVKVLSLVVVPSAVLHATLEPANTLGSYFFIPTRNAEGNVEPVLGVGWTLVFEMAFYALVALCLALRVRVLPTTGVVLVSCAALWWAFDAARPAWAVYFDPIILFFFIGMVTAELTRPARRGWLWAVLAVSLVALAVVLVVPVGDGGFGRNAPARFASVTAVIVATVLAERPLRRVTPGWVLTGGAASYALYLFHPLVAPAVPEVLSRLGVIEGWLSVVVSIPLLVFMSFVIHRRVERPLAGALARRARNPRLPHRTESREPRSADLEDSRDPRTTIPPD
jgi:exopolysaccharide production protein ExoZ